MSRSEKKRVLVVGVIFLACYSLYGTTDLADFFARSFAALLIYALVLIVPPLRRLITGKPDKDIASGMPKW